MVTVALIDPQGKLTEPVTAPKVVRSEEEWKKLLTPEQFRIMRRAGTEPAFCGGLLKNKEAGMYLCAGCNLALFRSDTKFESHTGWPSFFQPVAKENVREIADNAHGMVRTETVCARCDSHLGHVFDDGPRPTGMRFCMNSESLKFVKNEELKTVGEQLPQNATGTAANTAASANAGASAGSASTASLVLAGGCFWCVEAVFEELDGVKDAISGYAGGDKATANYQAVCSGDTKHAEAVKIVYDPARITPEQILKVHFATHDPTTKNRQGNDTGPQYRSAIFYANDQEKQLAEAFIADVTEAQAFKKPVVTTLEPLTEFFPAENYHQNYVCNNPNKGYVRSIALPKVEKVREKFKEMVKEQSPSAAK